MRERLGLFRLKDSGFAVPLERLLRVVEPGPGMPLPLSPLNMAGMLVLGDEIIPLLDSAWLPEVEAGQGLDARFKVLITTEYGPVALPADATVGIVAAGRGENVPGDQELEYFRPECFCYRGSRYQVLNVDKFIMSLTRS